MLRELYQALEGKAIPYTMELTDLGGPMISSGVGYYGAQNPYVPSSSVNWSRSNTPLSQREAAVHSQVFAGSEAVDWLMDALNFTINAASSTKIHFENPDDGTQYELKRDPQQPDEKLVDPILGKLFDMPNPYMDWELFLETTLIDFLLLGNAYWVKWGNPKKPVALYRMPPQFVRIIPDQFGPAKYLYKLPWMPQEQEYTPDQVLHFRRPNPLDAYFGAGLIKGGARAVDMELALTDTTASYYENQTNPSGVVQTERRVPRDVFNKLKQQLQAFYGGSRNAGRLLVLEAGLQFTAVSASAANAMFVEMGQWSRDRILAMLNMNAALIGMGDAADGDKVAGWQQLFDRKTMLPLLSKFGKAVSRGLTNPGWGLDLCFDYEETQAPVDVINRANLLAKLPGVKVKELRAAAKLPPSTGDSKIDELVLNMPGPNMGPTGQNGFPDRNLPGEAGRPPLPENTKVIGLGATGPAGGNGVIAPGNKSMTEDDVKAMVERISARARDVAEGKSLPPARVHIGDIQDARPPEDVLHASRSAAIDGIVASGKNDILKAVHELERGLLDASEGKAQGTMYQRVKNSAAWAEFRKKLADILQNVASRAHNMTSMHHVNAGHSPAEYDVGQVAKEQVYRPEGVLQIVGNFKQEVMQPILKLQRGGATPTEFTHAIMDGTAKWSNGHAEHVVLNEAIIAYNTGTAEIAAANGKNVLVSDGEDFDEPCAAANGQVWTVDYAREHLQEHPNCRRAFVPVDTPVAAQ